MFVIREILNAHPVYLICIFLPCIPQGTPMLATMYTYLTAALYSSSLATFWEVFIPQPQQLIQQGKVSDLTTNRAQWSRVLLKQLSRQPTERIVQWSKVVLSSSFGPCCSSECLSPAWTSTQVSLCAMCIEDIVALGQALLPVLRLSPVRFIPPTIHTYSFIYDRSYVIFTIQAMHV